jgi:peptide-methionine (S)-S-oxide reductase
MFKWLIVLFFSNWMVMNAQNSSVETATLGGGCFWCLEAVFEQVDGVKKVVSGYAGGRTINPTYEQVCEGTTGHAEVIQIEFDPAKVSFAHIVKVFFAMHDPTTLNRQGADVGTQYRSIAFYRNAQQQKVLTDYIAELERSGKFHGPIVTQVEPFVKFYAGESYHQGYYQRNANQPYCRIVIDPKLKKFKEEF